VINQNNTMITSKYSKARKNAPVFYFFGATLMNPIPYFLFPKLNIIHFPYTLFGIIFITSGYYIMNYSSKIFNKKETTFLLEKPKTFIQTGFYKKTRNPMYLGMLFMILGESILFGNILSFIIPIFFYSLINFFCIIPEEKIMEKTFKKEYIKYKNKVRRWI